MISLNKILVLAALTVTISVAVTAAELPTITPDTLRLTVGAYPGTRAELVKADSMAANIVAEADWFVWGGSVIADGGKYHMFAERWPTKYGFDCWLTHAEIAHYVADRPEGPFRFVKTVLTGRGKGHWDQIAAYNPYLCKFNGKYYLYYVSTQHSTLGEAGLIATAKAGGRGPNWRSVRDAQRVGLAVADSLDGPWQRSDTPVVEPHGPITRVTVNPAVCQGPDGRYHMIVKGDNPAAKGWGVFQATAVADKPEGPWQIQPTPAFNDYNTEDACLWYDSSQRRFYAVVHVCNQAFMAMITSTDGIKWEKAAQFKLMPKQIPLADGTSVTPSRMERPFVLTDAQGNPRQLYLAILSGDHKRAYNLTLKLEPAKTTAAPSANTTIATIPPHLAKYAELYRTDPRQASVKWFNAAKFGMMIHYGLTSVPGVHSFHQWKNKIPVAQYEKLVPGFKAQKFDAEAVADLAVAAGMKYITFVAKHCDGFCLWNTQFTAFNSMNSPAKRDFVAELVKACNQRGLGFFVFYEHGFEWHHPHGPRFKDFNSPLVEVKYPRPEPMYAYGKDYDLNKYLDFASNQIAETLTKYGPVAGVWLDGVAVPSSAKDPKIFRCQELYDRIHNLQPHALVSYKHGVTGTEDFKAPEACQLKDIKIGKESKPVELCEALNPSWSYVKGEKHRNAAWVWQRLAFTGEHEMNYLLCVGLLPDGSIPPEDAKTLQETGRRLKKEGWPKDAKKLEGEIEKPIAY